MDRPNRPTAVTVSQYFQDALGTDLKDALQFSAGFFFALAVMYKYPDYGQALHLADEREAAAADDVAVPQSSIDRLIAAVPLHNENGDQPQKPR